MLDPEIVAVNRKKAIALDDEDQVWNIIRWFDDIGDECDPSEAKACVATHEDTYRHVAVDLTQFEDMVIQ